jgi:hypothetical protein
MLREADGDRLGRYLEDLLRLLQNETKRLATIPKAKRISFVRGLVPVLGLKKVICSRSGAGRERA